MKKRFSILIALVMAIALCMVPAVAMAESSQADLTVNCVQPTLTLNIVGNGTVAVGYGTPDKPMASTEYYIGPTTVKLNATLGTVVGLIAMETDSAFMLESWAGDVEPHWFMKPHAYYRQVTLDADKTATVTFVEKVVSVTVDPTSIDFGPILQGSSGSASLSVTNSGNVPIGVTASLITEVPVDFYTTNLKMDTVSVVNWGIGKLVPSVSVPVSLELTIPANAPPGPKTATIVFIATAK